MEHVSFVLKIKPEQVEEYKKRHLQVYPDLEAKFADVGIKRYHIFFHDDGTLFAYMEVEDYEKAMQALDEDPANARWQEYMADMLLSWENGEKSKRIEEVYRFTS